MLLVAIVLTPALNSTFGASDQGVPVSMVVSVEAKQGETVPAVNREDVVQTPVSFSPFLDEFAERLKHQYRVTFLASPQKQASYQNVRLTTEVSNAEMVAAPRVYVPAAR